MIPGRTVVAGPGRAVALTTGEAGTRHNKGPLVRPKREQAFISAARVLHAVYVVDFQMRGSAFLEARLVDAMLNIVRHGLGGGFEHRGFVHVVPESSNPIVNKRLVEGSPPLPCLCPGEIRKDGG